MKDYQKEYRKNMTDEQKQKYKKAKKNYKITDEQKQKYKDYQKEYYTAKKLTNKNIQNDKNENENEKIIMIIIKEL